MQLLLKWLLRPSYVHVDGLLALGAGLRHDEFAYRHLSFASCRFFSGVFSIHKPNTRNDFVLWRQLLPRFHYPLVFTCSRYYAGIAPCESRYLTRNGFCAIWDCISSSSKKNLRALTFKGSEMVLRGGEFLCFSGYSCATRPNSTCVVRRCGEFGRAF